MYPAAVTTANEVAKYVIWQSQEVGDPITNLKLQKLLYYIQGWYLGLNANPLFDDDFQAWVHGPVVPNIFHEHKAYRWNPISTEMAKPTLDPAVESHISDVLEVYGGDTGWELEHRTHKEQPWIAARGKLPADENSSAVITKISMQQFFKQLAENER